ncbi:MAG: TonB-dependent receptor [candidate division KSB1 bacterium]|nr:TonB-dependent receptor [candidate division KSB1 bacterium]MDZ7319625.1 TonB-dependent receptor [candidate division KSB1 bacterium]MDZ7340371.1 TonB-dependent receptor [candidate division KSB1 bacterium]
MRAKQTLLILSFLLFYFAVDGINDGPTFSPPSVMAGTTGKIAGRVVDADSKNPLPNANVIVNAQVVDGKEIPLDLPIGAATDIRGEYFILNVRPGNYVVKVMYIGYQSVIRKPVNVSVDQTTRLNFELMPQTIEGEEVVITAERQLIVKDRTSASAKVTGEDIKSLPVESFQDVMEIQAGVTRGLDGSLHIRGGRSSEIQYYVDGIVVSNPFTNSIALPVENNAIQELEVISGTFNAEYGQAMSGIVNIVTKDGTDQFTGNFTTYVGDFLSNHTDVFNHIDDFSPLAQQYYETSLSGPLLFKDLKFFASARVVDQDNWLYGTRRFVPGDSSNFSATNPNEWYIEETGDNQRVPMNPYQSFSGQLKLSYNLSPAIKLSYNIMANKNEGKNYNHYYKLNPDALPTNFTTAYNHLFKAVHILTPGLYYNLNFAYTFNDLKSYVYKDPYDLRYRSIYRRGSPPQNTFSTGGVIPSQFFRTSKSFGLKADVVWQATKLHLFKFGAESRYHSLNYEYYQIDVDPFKYGDFNPRIPPLTSLDHNQYNKRPLELAFYVQDKIEIDDFIVNVGLRFDYFNSNSKVPIDLRDPANKLFPQPEAQAYESAKAKTQLSPRLGLAFPFTEKGVIHASYGQFFQIPEFSRLYENPEFEVAGVYGSFLGNADLEPQRTDMYEIGLQQQVTDFLVVDATGFYRDVRNLLGTELHQTYRGDIIYGRYINTDYGAVRGITLSSEFRFPAAGLNAGLDYTYQVAKGIASDPKQVFFDAQGLTESQTILIPLNWDLRHTINAFLNYSQQHWGCSMIMRMNSGYPFTPPDPSTKRQREINELRNTGRFKGDLFMDVRAYRRFTVGQLSLEAFVKIENLLDKLRRDLFPEVDPRDRQAHQNNGLERINTLYDYRLNPVVQPTPREIKFGLKIDF